VRQRVIRRTLAATQLLSTIPFVASIGEHGDELKVDVRVDNVIHDIEEDRVAEALLHATHEAVVLRCRW